jgi:hypothetical protein
MSLIRSKAVGGSDCQPVAGALLRGWHPVRLARILEVADIGLEQSGIPVEGRARRRIRRVE